MSIVDVVLGALVVGLAGWALVQTGSAKPARGSGCGGGCSPSCGPDERRSEAEPLGIVGAPAQERAGERRLSVNASRTEPG